MDDILFETQGALGLVTLNRPRTLNALTLDMIHALADRLGAWEGDDAIAAVLIRGAGDKAFCAGGDVRALYDLEEDGGAFIAGFFRDEYRLNRMIFRYAKPYIALIDGIAMGGGVGVSVNGAYRVATEATVFAMPETGIGMFPDVGASYFLPRCAGQTGLYLGLTGARLKAADCLHTGIAHGYITAPAHDRLIELLAAGHDPAVTIQRLNQDAGEAPLADRRAAIDRCFAGESVEAIMEALEAEGDDWAGETLAALGRKSPLLLKVAYRQLRAGHDLDFENCMAMEYRLSQRIVPGGDFREGVRAAVIDKDRDPRWDPARLADVGEAAVEACFAPLPDGEELTFD